MFREAEGHIVGDDTREPLTNPAQSETPGMPGHSMRENRETPLVSGRSMPDRLEKATSYKTSVYASGESDERVVPAKRSNNGEQSRTESVEGSRSTKGNIEGTYTRRTQGRASVSQGLQDVREAARRDRKQKFSASGTWGALRRQIPEVGAVCAKVRPYGSVRGASGNGCPYRD